MRTVCTLHVQACELLPRHDDPRFWARHLGSDALCTMWFFSIAASLMECGVLLLCWLLPSAKMWFLLADGLFLVLAMWLMLSAAAAPTVLPTLGHPRGHPPLRRPTRLLRAALWAQGKRPGRVGAEERLLRRPSACPESPIPPPFDCPRRRLPRELQHVRAFPEDRRVGQ